MKAVKLEADLDPTFESVELLAHRPIDSPQSAFSRWFQPQSPSRAHTVALWIKRSLLVLAGIVSLGLVLKSTIHDLPSGKSIDHLRHSWLQVATTMNATAGWVSRPSSKNSSSPCGWSPCLDEKIGARIVHDEIAHMVNISNLLDGCGRQFSWMLDPDREHKDAAYAAHSVQDIDPISANVTQEIRKFLNQIPQLNSRLVWMASDVAGRLSRNGTIHNHLHRALQQLRHVQSMRQAASTPDFSARQLRLYNNVIRTSVTSLVGNLSLELGQMLPGIQNITSLGVPIGLQGAQILVDLDNELLRVTQILKSLPWWESWSGTWQSSRTDYLRPYLQFMTSEGLSLRLIVEDVQMVMKNLQSLQEYCDLYIKRQPVNIDDIVEHLPPTSRTVSLDDIESAIGQLLQDADLIEDDAGNPSSDSPPQRV